jgi:hypothetical protein
MSQVMSDEELTSCPKKTSYCIEPAQPTPLKGTRGALNHNNGYYRFVQGRQPKADERDCY